MPAGEKRGNDDEFDIAVNNYCANSQLLMPGEIFREGDLPVLAVDAAQIAAGKENSPAAVPSGDHGLFRVVKSGACRPEHTAFAAEAALSLQPVHMTVPGTQGAVRENADGV